MLVVDSSVWIDHFRGRLTPQTDELARLLTGGEVDLLVPDLVLFEVVRGFTLDREARLANRVLHTVAIVPTTDPALALTAAQHYRRLRALGITVRSAIDVLIATYCIAHDHPLLHNDRDFDPFAAHLGLKVWSP